MTAPVGATLWRAHKTGDDDAVVRVGAKAVPQGLALGVLLDGTWTGLILSRSQVQELRHALTDWLVDASPNVPPVSIATAPRELRRLDGLAYGCAVLMGTSAVVLWLLHRPTSWLSEWLDRSVDEAVRLPVRW